MINDQWSGEDGSEWSGGIEQRTVYTLRCDGQVVDTATVNVIPVFIEL
jgi:hypothetical protein